MWIRKDLKDRAKAVLRKIYWKAFLVSLVIALATGGGGSGGGRSSYQNTIDSGSPFGDNPLGWVMLIYLIIGAMLVALGIRILLGFPLEVGGRRYFVQSAQYYDNRGCFKFAFRGENYLKIVLTMFLKGIFNFLWFLLFIIPGIVKYYAYAMVPYILADNPNIGAKKAIAISKQMTQGHKFDMFVLDLSFLGWYLLGVLALGIGTLFVLPYDYATKAELYLVLRQNALDRRMCSYDDLGLIAPEY